MPIALTNISDITPSTSPLAVNGSLNLVGTAPVPGYQVNGAPLITGLAVQHAGTAVATQPAINFTDTATATILAANDAGNNRVNISITAIATGALADPTTTLGDLIVRGAAAPPTRLGIGPNGQVLLADSGQTLGMHWATLTSDLVNLNPNINAWGTVQVAISNLNTASPATILTTQGDILGRSATAAARIAVGTNGQVLEADSAQPLGVHWVTPPATPASILTTLGDIIVRSGTAPVRLPAGTNGQVLEADSTATNGVHWATIDATDIDLNPDINSWGTVQVAITNLNTASPGSVLTTLGDIIVRSATAPVRLPVGTNGQVLEADSAATNGVHWATPSSPANILTTLGDLIVRGATVPARLGVGTNGQTLLADSTQTNGLHWATMTADLVNLNPTVSTWTTVQNAISNISTTLTTLLRGMAYVGHFNGTTGVATFVPAMSSLDGPIPAANATGIEEGDFLVVTTAGTYNATPVVVGDQLISGGSAGGATWIILPIGANMASVTAATVNLAPVIGSWTTVQVALTALAATGHPAGAVGQVQFNAGGTPNVFGASANLFWDGTNSRLGVNQAAPAYAIDVTGAINCTTGFYIGGVLYAEPGSAHLKATSIAGIDGEPIEIHGELSHNGRKINLDAVLERLEKLEALLAMKN